MGGAGLLNRREPSPAPIPMISVTLILAALVLVVSYDEAGS
ncbi:MAG: hypothetical protein ACHQ5A_11145 [Opitutales bacterium]